MTKTTEELKHALYEKLKLSWEFISPHGVGGRRMTEFEDSLEDYLEALRKDAMSESQRLTETIRYNAVLSDAYAHQQGLTHAACVEARQAWDETYELKSKVQGLSDANDYGCRVLMKLTEERDELRNKLQAFEFANKSAGEFLQEARAKVRTQRQSIGQLKNERDNANFREKVQSSKLEKALQELSELRKAVGGTSAQSSQVCIACSKCGGSGRILTGMNQATNAPETISCGNCAHLRV